MKTNDKMRISLPESRKMHSWDFNFSKFPGGHVPRPPKALVGLQPSTNLGICLLYTSCPSTWKIYENPAINLPDFQWVILALMTSASLRKQSAKWNKILQNSTFHYLSIDIQVSLKTVCIWNFSGGHLRRFGVTLKSP